MSEQEIICFNRQGSSINQVLKENPTYHQIYLNTKTEGNVTKIFLTKDKGELLYIVSNVKYDDVKKYFEKSTTTQTANVKPVETKQVAESVKRKKQTTLFSFMKK